MKRTFTVVVALALAIPFGIPAFGASTTGGNHDPIRITSDADFTPAGAATGCACVSSVDTTTGVSIIGPWTIWASGQPGVSVVNSGRISKHFTLLHITVHTAGDADGILLQNVKRDSITQVNIDTSGALATASTNNGIELINTIGVSINGDSINTMGGWGIRVVGGSGNHIEFMTVAHAGLSTPNSVGSSMLSFSDPTNPWIAGVTGDASGGVLLKNTTGNTVHDNLFNEDAYAGLELVGASGNIVSRINVRYPDYFGMVLQSSNGNTLDGVSLQTADFDGLLMRASNGNTVINSTFSANGPIGNEWNAQVVPYFIAGAYVGWGSNKNTFTSNNGNFGNTGPDLVLDDGTLLTKATQGFFFNGSLQVKNPLNFLSTYKTLGVRSLAAGSGNTVCGNSFAPLYWYPLSLNANNPC